MKATRRASAPNSAAMITIADAAPGHEPHTLVVPGMTRQRLMTKPRKLLAATIAKTTARMTGHSSRKEERIEGVIALAMKSPIKAWAPA